MYGSRSKGSSFFPFFLFLFGLTFDKQVLCNKYFECVLILCIGSFQGKNVWQ